MNGSSFTRTGRRRRRRRQVVGRWGTAAAAAEEASRRAVGAAAASSHASSYFIFRSRLTLRRDRFLVRGFISTWACRSQPAGTDVRRITILGEYAPMSRVEIGVSERPKGKTNDHDRNNS